jgi:Caspase domain/TIR domain
MRKPVAELLPPPDPGPALEANSMPGLQNAHALVIGIADYHNVRKLPPFRDAAAIAALLANGEQGGYPPAQVRLRRDGEATKANLVADLAQLAAAADSDSTVFIAFSGHGTRVPTGTGSGEYLLPVDANLKSVETLAATSISDVEFSEAIAAILARKLVIVLDCCHAGGIGVLRDASALPLRDGLSEDYYQRLTQGQGRVIFSAARDTEYSIQLSGDDLGLFTKHLLAGLQGGAVNEDGLVTIFGLFEYVQPLVTIDNPQQHPKLTLDVEQNFPIALWRGGTKAGSPRGDDGFRYDAYISYADSEPDATWVEESLLPKLEAAGLRVAISEDVAVPGVERVVNFERGITQAKRTVVVLSTVYLTDRWSHFENVLGQSLGLAEGTYRLLPVLFQPVPPDQMPTRLGMLEAVNIADERRGERNWSRLIEAVRGPLPRMETVRH